MDLRELLVGMIFGTSTASMDLSNAVIRRLHELDFEVDGLVLKVNDFGQRQRLLRGLRRRTVPVCAADGWSAVGVGVVAAVPVAVHERSCDRTGTRVQVFVAAPDREIRARLVQRKRDVAYRVCQVEADEAAVPASSCSKRSSR